MRMSLEGIPARPALFSFSLVRRLLVWVVVVLLASAAASQFYRFATFGKELYAGEQYETTAAGISTFHTSNPPASPSPAEIRIMTLTDRLGTQKLRYFVYNNSVIEQTDKANLDSSSPLG
jgi:hypothetical protein